MNNKSVVFLCPTLADFHLVPIIASAIKMTNSQLDGRVDNFCTSLVRYFPQAKSKHRRMTLWIILRWTHVDGNFERKIAEADGGCCEKWEPRDEVTNFRLVGDANNSVLTEYLESQNKERSLGMQVFSSSTLTNEGNLIRNNLKKNYLNLGWFNN